MAQSGRYLIGAETDRAAEGRSLFIDHAPDVVLIGMTFRDGDGVDLIKGLLKIEPAARVLVLSTRNDTLSVQRAFRAGARGYILTTDEPAEILGALDKVLAGGRFASSGVQQCILDELTYGDLTPARPEIGRLSDRELQVLRGIASGYGMTQLARQLHLSVKTVETYRTQVRSKLGLQSSDELRHWAAEWRQATLGGFSS